MLRCLTALLENPVSRPLLLPGLLKNSGLNEFRQVVSTSPPTMFPTVDSPDSERDEADGAVTAGAVAANATGRTNDHGSQRTVIDYARSYRDGTASPADVAERVIEAIQASNQLTPPLRGIIQCDPDDVRRQAGDSIQRLTQGNPRSILEGVPVAIKDEMDMLPYGTTVGTRFLGHQPPPEDSAVAARLRAAGALLVGKANMYEIGIAPLGNNPIHGFARNPWNTGFETGGSSSGCGAAVAAGIVPLAIGADGGGSVRVPAALCGIHGLKPTFGRISSVGSASLCWSVGHLGPLGATALDAAIGYAICGGRDQRDSTTIRQPPLHLNEFHNSDLSGLKIGICEPWFQDADPDIVRSCEATVQMLEQMGAQRQSVMIDGLEESRLAHAVTILSEMATATERYDQAHRKEFTHPTRINLALGREFTSSDYVRAQRIRTDAMRIWKSVLSQVDIVLTPTTACTAPPLRSGTEQSGESDLTTVTRLMKFIIPGNLCGMPAISFPSGYDSNGLPVGMQAIGRHWEEHLLLRVAHAAERQTECRTPTVHYDPLNAG